MLTTDQTSVYPHPNEHVETAPAQIPTEECRSRKRNRLRDEIDAIGAHLYGLSRADFGHILGTFPLVFPDDESGRLKRVALLEVYDEWVDNM